MTTPQQTALAYAKQGNPEAIAALMRKQLAEKGIQVRVERKGALLVVSLGGKQAPSKADSLSFVGKGIKRIGIEGVQSVQVRGYQLGNSKPIWVDRISLISPVKNNADLPKENQEKLPFGLSKPKSISISRLKNSFTSLQLSHKILVAVTGLTCISFLPLIAVKSLNSPEKTVNNFLIALRNSEKDKALKNWCYQRGSTLFAVREWEVLNTQKQKLDIESKTLKEYIPNEYRDFKHLNNKSYHRVVARIKSSNKGGSEITSDWVFSVWNSKEAYKSHQDMSILREVVSNISVDDNEIGKLLTKSQLSVALVSGQFLKITGSKEELTSKKYCITSLESFSGD